MELFGSRVGARACKTKWNYVAPDVHERHVGLEWEPRHSRTKSAQMHVRQSGTMLGARACKTKWNYVGTSLEWEPRRMQDKVVRLGSHSRPI